MTPSRQERELAGRASKNEALPRKRIMLRLFAGTSGVGIPPSRWLILTGIFAALFLGFSKRRAETFHVVASQRSVLEHYPPALLDIYVAVTMTALRSDDSVTALTVPMSTFL